jgi:quercetin dioxygenase-like cupin family protein
MIIDFAKMEDTVLHNFYGGELDTVAKMYLDENHRIMFDTLDPGASIGFHKHENSDEVIYVLEGRAKRCITTPWSGYIPARATTARGTSTTA